ncbi:MAG: UvrB/UvrC motif-containing protein [Puniceicoccales bacterium]|jgi:protein arginine kinase activator|nr:UvrB/UvrC motif-containing protein [Puniceicoccales bacterium]
MAETHPCSKCGQPATVHLTQINDGQVAKIHFCEKCAAESGTTAVSLSSFASMITGLQPLRPEGPVCPACGFKENDFKQTSRLGCPVCYETFSQELHPLLKHIQRAAKHKGKAPAGRSNLAVLNDALEDARTRMRNAIETEAYEDAARWRDEIRHLEEKLQASEKDQAVKC